jgi:hypothetical protein
MSSPPLSSRPLRIALLISFLVTLALALLWERSLLAADIFARRHSITTLDTTDSRNFRIIATDGGVTFSYVRNQEQGILAAGYHVHPQVIGPTWAYTAMSETIGAQVHVPYGIGFNSAFTDRAPGPQNPRYIYRAWSLRIEYWPLTVFAALLTSALFVMWYFRIRRPGRRLAAGMCPACGYDIRATPEKCPECGTEISNLKFQAPDKSQIANGKSQPSIPPPPV